MRRLKRLLELLFKLIYYNTLALYNLKNKKLTKKNLSLKNKFEGERLFLVMTGQSVDHCDLKALRNEYVMGVNFMMLHKDFRSSGCNFYAMSSTWNSFTEQLCNWIITNVYKNANENCLVFLNSTAHNWVKKNQRYIEDNTFFVSHDAFCEGGEIPYCGLSHKYKGSFPFSIGIAIELGFKEIYLIGADYCKTPKMIGHFYSPENEVHEQSQEYLNLQFELDEYARYKEVKIYNVVDDGFLSPVFEAVCQTDLKIILEKSFSQPSPSDGSGD